MLNELHESFEEKSEDNFFDNLEKDGALHDDSNPLLKLEEDPFAAITTVE